jgi:hypothetical protein
MKDGEVDNDKLKDILLPNRTREEIKLQLVKIEKTDRERRRGSKLEELQKEEEKLFNLEEMERVMEIEKRRSGLDNVLGLSGTKADVTRPEEVREAGSMISEEREGESIKASLDQILGLVGESEEQRRKRELDEALGLSKPGVR